MRNFRLLPLVCTAGLVTWLAAAPASAGDSGKSAFEGTSWRITVDPGVTTARRGEKVFEATLTFQDGKIPFLDCARCGFPATAYKSDNHGGGRWDFEATLTSPTEGRAVFEGDAKSDSIRGGLVIKPLKGPELIYIFRGPKVKDEQAGKKH